MLEWKYQAKNNSVVKQDMSETGKQPQSKLQMHCGEHRQQGESAVASQLPQQSRVP
jgi:hypothetical protein